MGCQLRVIFVHLYVCTCMFRCVYTVESLHISKSLHLVKFKYNSFITEIDITLDEDT